MQQFEKMHGDADWSPPRKLDSAFLWFFYLIGCNIWQLSFTTFVQTKIGKRDKIEIETKKKPLDLIHQCCVLTVALLHAPPFENHFTEELILQGLKSLDNMVVTVNIDTIYTVEWEIHRQYIVDLLSNSFLKWKNISRLSDLF